MNNDQEGNGGDSGAAGETNDDSNEVCATIHFFEYYSIKLLFGQINNSPNGQLSFA